MKDAKKVILKDLLRRYTGEKISYITYCSMSDKIINSQDGHDIHHYNKILEGVK